MNLKKISQLISAELHAGSINDQEIEFAFGSDLMSDVLTVENSIPLLITGLANTQSIRTAEMADINTIIIARGKKITQGMMDLANDSDITLLSTSFSLFKVCGLLFQHGIKPLY